MRLSCVGRWELNVNVKNKKQQNFANAGHLVWDHGFACAKAYAKPSGVALRRFLVRLLLPP